MRIAMGVEYDGRAFFGWQRQAEVRSVQAAVEQAIAAVADHPVEVTCAGRTDAGVHATGQVIHFDTAAARPLRGWLLGTNSHLPADAGITWVQPVPEDFHARFSATHRRYRYAILNRTTRPGLEAGRVSWHHRPLDEERMRAAARMLLGEHDFSSFRSFECQARTPVRKLRRLDVVRRGDHVWLDALADGFLHHMVRNLAGVLLEVGDGRRPPEWAREVLEARDRRAGGVTAPPGGLYLVEVGYPPEFALPAAPAEPAFW